MIMASRKSGCWPAARRLALSSGAVRTPLLSGDPEAPPPVPLAGRLVGRRRAAIGSASSVWLAALPAPAAPPSDVPRRPPPTGAGSELESAIDASCLRRITTSFVSSLT